VINHPRHLGALPLTAVPGKVAHVFELRNDAMANGRRENQVSVTLDPSLRAALERAAEADHRTIAGQIRHIVASTIEEQREHRDPPHDGGHSNLEARS
jgi:hypothetical protein